MPFKKGQSGNPKGRKSVSNGGEFRSRPPTVLYDIKQAARAYCEEAIERLAMHMRSSDEKVSIMAALALIDRGYGKPEQKVDANVVHKFAVVPQVMEEAEWLARKGQPKPLALPAPDLDHNLN